MLDTFLPYILALCFLYCPVIEESVAFFSQPYFSNQKIKSSTLMLHCALKRTTSITHSQGKKKKRYKTGHWSGTF